MWFASFKTLEFKVLAGGLQAAECRVPGPMAGRAYSAICCNPRSERKNLCA